MANMQLNSFHCHWTQTQTTFCVFKWKHFHVFTWKRKQTDFGTLLVSFEFSDDKKKWFAYVPVMLHNGHVVEQKLLEWRVKLGIKWGFLLGECELRQKKKKFAENIRRPSYQDLLTSDILHRMSSWQAERHQYCNPSLRRMINIKGS